MTFRLKENINRIQKERIKMSQDHNRKYNSIKNRIKQNDVDDKNCQMQKRIEKELSRHF